MVASKNSLLYSLFTPTVCHAVEVALQEIGEIKPWWDADVEAWVFQHPLYPEECGGETAEQVIAEYPLVLANFMQARLAGELAPSIEAKTKGRGGYRVGSGRPKGSTSAPPTNTN